MLRNGSIDEWWAKGPINTFGAGAGIDERAKASPDEELPTADERETL
jgi:hypothetical protein